MNDWHLGSRRFHAGKNLSHCASELPVTNLTRPRVAMRTLSITSAFGELTAISLPDEASKDDPTGSYYFALQQLFDKVISPNVPLKFASLQTKIRRARIKTVSAPKHALATLLRHAIVKRGSRKAMLVASSQIHPLFDIAGVGGQSTPLLEALRVAEASKKVPAAQKTAKKTSAKKKKKTNKAFRAPRLPEAELPPQLKQEKDEMQVWWTSPTALGRRYAAVSDNTFDGYWTHLKSFFAWLLNKKSRSPGSLKLSQVTDQSLIDGYFKFVSGWSNGTKNLAVSYDIHHVMITNMILFSQAKGFVGALKYLNRSCPWGDDNRKLTKGELMQRNMTRMATQLFRGMLIHHTSYIRTPNHEP